MPEDHYGAALSDICSGYAALKPPLRVTVAEGAAANLVIRQTGTAGGPWDPNETPYMIEPMNMLSSRRHEAVAFCGPARTGKTAALLIGWMSHTIVNDAGDILIIHMSKDKAREFSKTDVDRALTNSPKLKAMKSDREVDSNTFDTKFRNGIWLRIAWPTSGNVSGSTYRYTMITDLDRIANAEDVDGEGPLFDLAKKRTTTFLSRGMSMVESSPGIELVDPAWRPASKHEAPPVTGILGIYNRGFRKRWYWQCPDCAAWFEAAPGLSLFHLPPDEELLEIVRTVDISAMAAEYGSRIVCPCCGVIIPAKAKTALNKGGRWLGENQWIEDGVVMGTESSATIASYWLGGVAAAYQSWKSLIERELQGLKEYALNGSEEVLKTTRNTDQGVPYMSRHLVESNTSGRSPEDRADAAVQRYVAPEWTRCLMASVDVQGGVNSRFVVQVHSVGPYMEQQLVDRFEIKLSMREGMGQEFAPIDPASYPEDWDVLTEQLLRATWRTPTEGQEIRLKMLVVDSGGEDGVTANAEAWFRRVREAGMGDRVRLYKGASSKTAPVIKVSMVGKRTAKGKADIPLLLCNPNLLSDAVNAGLKRQDRGPGYIHFPAPKHPTLNPNGWLPQSFFDELTAETRGKNGTWSQIRKRNETFDLCRMMRAGMLHLKLDKVKDWANVPTWLAPLDKNSEVVTAEARREMKENTPIAQAVEQAAPRAPKPKRARRVAASPYLR